MSVAASNGLDQYIRAVLAQLRRREPGAEQRMAELTGIMAARRADSLGSADRKRLCDASMVEVTCAAIRLQSPPLNCESWISERIDQVARRHASFVAQDRDRAADTFGRLMPARSVNAHGLEVAVSFQSFDIVGGDFFDHSVTDRDALIAFGDVAGKGMAAAEWASYLLGQLRSLTIRIRNPHTLTKRLDTFLHAASGPAEYAALTISRWLPDRRTLIMTNAGYPQPHRVRRGSITQIGGQGNPLGLMRDARFSVTYERLEPGDVIFIASDGISEQPSNSGRDLDIGKLIRRLKISPTDSAELLAHQAWKLFESATRGRGRRDDQTLAVLRFSPET